jgi:type III secretory pathway component EscS
VIAQRWLRPARLAWLTLALSVALFLAQVVLIGLTPMTLWGRRAFFWPVDPTNFSLLAYSAVGALIAARRPRNPVGWLFCGMGLGMECFGCAQAYLSYLFLVAPGAFHVDDPVLVLGLNLWVVAFGLFPFLLLLFPNGQLLSRRWRTVLWLWGLAIAAMYVSAQSGFRAGSTPLNFPSPLQLMGIDRGTRLADLVLGVGEYTFVASYVVGGIALVLRLRRARGDERQQLKWFVSAGLLIIAAFLATTVFFEWLHPLDPEALYSADLFFGLPFALPLVAIPVAVAFAVFKYRLYDIDLIIRRTLVYSLLTTLLALIYLGSVGVLQNIFGAFTGQRESTLLTVLSTLAIAALFVPLRNWLQAAIDRRFYRRKYDAARTLAAFSNSVRDEVQLDRLAERLTEVVDETLEPETVTLWLQPPASDVKQ